MFNTYLQAGSSIPKAQLLALSPNYSFFEAKARGLTLER